MNSKIIIGTWPLSGDYGKIESNQVTNVLEYCYRLGIREFDTAPNYGNGLMENYLGDIFGDKNDVLINTKVGNTSFKEKNYEISSLKHSLTESLKRLKRNSINILFLHNPRNEITDYAPILEFLRDLKDKKIINQFGLSKAKNFDYEKYVNLNEFDVIQEDVNLLCLDAISSPKKIKNTLMVRSPLASGLLSGNITKKTIFPKNDHRSDWLHGKRLESLLKRINKIQDCSDIELSELAIRFLINHDSINKVIFGIKTKEHIDNIVKNSKKTELDTQLIDKIFELFETDFGLDNESQFRY